MLNASFGSWKSIDRMTSYMSSLFRTRITLPGEQAPTLGTASLILHLIGPCWGPAPCVPCYMHRQGNASLTWPVVLLVRPCPLGPRHEIDVNK